MTLASITNDAVDVARASDGELLRLAGKGCGEAWDELVSRFRGLLARIARRNGVPDSEAEDVAQATWVRLWQHADQIRDPERLAGWLATTAHRESVKLAMRSMRQVPVADIDLIRDEVTTTPANVTSLALDGDSRIEAAIESLPPNYRLLIRMLISDRDLTYAEMAQALRVPVGSIGPMRLRCLQILRRHLTRAYSADDAAPSIARSADVGRGRDAGGTWATRRCVSA